jgi:hypothetical protein
MPGIRFLAFVLGAGAMIPSAMAQEIDLFADPTNDNVVSKDSGDIKALKKGKWIVVSVERDGQTVPAQFGQKPGDIITFKTRDGLTVLY